MRRTFLLFVLVCMLPLVSQAQRGGGAMPSMGGAHAFVAAAPRGVAHAAPGRASIGARPVGRTSPAGTRLGAAPRTGHPTGWNRTTHANNFSTDPVFPNGGFSTGGNPVPGLGFDYPHFFAVHPNAGRHFRRDSGFVIPFFDGGFYLPVPMYADQGPDGPPPADDVEAANQPGPPPDQTSTRESDSSLISRMRSEPLPPEQPEYVFVRQDGSLIFAVAYTVINDRLQYVTSEGIRRTIPLNTLDIGATQQFNDQRGVSIRLPA